MVPWTGCVSPVLTARVLGEDAGFWSIRPVDGHSSTRRYLGPTMVLETAHTTAGGAVTVTDALVLGEGNRGHELGAGAPGTLLRQVACLAGEVVVEVVFAPKPEYGLIMPRLSGTADGILVSGGADVLAFSTPVSFDLAGGAARARLVLRAGDVLGFALHHRHSWQGDPPFWSQGEIARRLEDTLEGWASWSRMHQKYVATAAASRLSTGAELQIMYGVGGERDLSERELVHLPGWRDSSPVRVGNGAWNQRQLDVCGELLDAAATLPDYLNDLEPVAREFLADAADTAASRWQSRDHGIWEVRGTPRHYLHSKLMCWVAVDRAIGLVNVLDAEDRVPHWIQARAQLADSIRMNGWNDTAGAYTQAYGSEDLDASALMLAIVGIVPADDPRMLATIDAIENRLTDSRGLVYRYQTPDGLAGEEGAFLLCTFWLAHALALSGQTRRARTVFERAAGFATDLGLLAEEVAPDSRELLGNFPQAFSHIGLVNSAWAIRTAEDRNQARRPTGRHPGGHEQDHR